MNELAKMERDTKVDYYQKYFAANKNKASAIWKGIWSIVNLNNTTRKDITLLNDKGKNISDPIKISELLNKYFVNVVPSIDKKIPKELKNFKDYTSKIKVNRSFFLNPTTHKKYST